MTASVELPRFFSVFLSHYSSESFLIPSTYYEHLPSPLPKTAILTGTSGRFWRVSMMSRRQHVYFEQGWSTFVADNELRDGEFLTFVFDGHQSYEVSIYGHGSCKETRAAIQVEQISDDTEVHNVDTSSSNSFNTPPITPSDNDTQDHNDNDFSEFANSTRTKRHTRG